MKIPSALRHVTDLLMILTLLGLMAYFLTGQAVHEWLGRRCWSSTWAAANEREKKKPPQDHESCGGFVCPEAVLVVILVRGTPSVRCISLLSGYNDRLRFLVPIDCKTAQVAQAAQLIIGIPVNIIRRDHAGYAVRHGRLRDGRRRRSVSRRAARHSRPAACMA